MNPRMTDLRRLDHHDFERGSGLPLAYFYRPWFRRRGWWIVAGVVTLLALLGLGLTAGDLPNL